MFPPEFEFKGLAKKLGTLKFISFLVYSTCVCIYIYIYIYIYIFGGFGFIF